MIDTRTPMPHVLSPRRPSGRLFTSIALGVIAWWLTPSRIAWWVRAVAGWDVASFALLAFAWVIILRANADDTQRRAGDDDPGHYIVFVIAILTSLISLFAATIVLREVKSFSPAEKPMWTLLTLVAVPLSWALTHTEYTFRYAHEHYKPREAREGNAEGDLKFCGTNDPSDIDFAYFAFTIGMCFQVSDVVVVTTQMRRVVFVHAIVSFVYTTTILALALNIVSGMMS